LDNAFFRSESCCESFIMVMQAAEFRKFHRPSVLAGTAVIGATPQ